MKKNTLTTAVLAGVAGVVGMANVSQAVNLNADGLGEVLLYPYYTVNNGNDTLVSIVNTTDQVKAVKVRFLESYNSQEVLDFNLYMSPFDVWTGAIDADGDGARLITNDTSCTVPAIPAGGQPFTNFLFGTLPNDGGPTDISRVNEGHIEVIEMGEVASATEDDLGWNAIHIGNPEIPRDCPALVSAWDLAPAPGGIWTQTDGAQDLTEPTGGLFGSATLINVDRAYAGGYAADALDAWSDIQRHAFSGSTQPNLGEASPATAIVFDSGVAFTLPFVDGIDAVSATLMRASVMNEWIIDPAIGAETEWVVTFPTKSFYVNGIVPVAPFTTTFPEPDPDDNDGVAPEAVGVGIWNREERSTTPGSQGPCFSPAPDNCGLIAGGNPTLDFEANVISFGPAAEGGTPLLGSMTSRFIDPNEFIVDGSPNEGWTSLDFTVDPGHVLATAGGANTMNGLPVHGFSLWTASNNTVVADAVASYGSITQHRARRSIS